MKRVTTGVPGLDALAGGGLVRNSVCLVSGMTGTGKTTIASQFLWHGLRNGERAVFISMEEQPAEIKEDMKVFGWDFGAYEKRGTFSISYHNPAQVEKLGSVIQNEILGQNADRIVIDSITALTLGIDDMGNMRRTIAGIFHNLKKRKECTALVTTEVPEGSKQLSRSGVEEFVADGVIVLYYAGIGGEEESYLQVRKMRRTHHKKGFYPLVFTPTGLKVRRRGTSVLMK